MFFYKHLTAGGKIVRVDLPLVVYRYHSHCTTHTVHRYVLYNSSILVHIAISIPLGSEAEPIIKVYLT